MDLEQRIRMAAESILENEALREGFDQEATEAILVWGTFCAKLISSETAHLEDDLEAEEVMYPRMRALRQMIKVARNMINAGDIATRIATIQSLTQQAALVYGEKYVAPQPGQMGALVANPGNNQVEIVQNLRNLFEAPSQGDKHA